MAEFWSTGLAIETQIQGKGLAYSEQFDNPLVTVDIPSGTVKKYRFRDTWAKEGYTTTPKEV